MSPPNPGTVEVPIRVRLEVYTIQEVADMLKVDHKVVRQAIKDGELDAFRVGRQWRITVHALQRYMAGDSD